MKSSQSMDVCSVLFLYSFPTMKQISAKAYLSNYTISLDGCLMITESSIRWSTFSLPSVAPLLQGSSPHLPPISCKLKLLLVPGVICHPVEMGWDRRTPGSSLPCSPPQPGGRQDPLCQGPCAHSRPSEGMGIFSLVQVRQNLPAWILNTKIRK